MRAHRLSYSWSRLARFQRSHKRQYKHTGAHSDQVMSRSRQSTIAGGAEELKDGSNAEKGQYDVDIKPDPYEVKLEPQDDPQQRSLLNRWISVVTISSGSVLATCASSAVRLLLGAFVLVILTVSVGLVYGGADRISVPCQQRGYDSRN